jgi:hypothetical protein
VAQNDTQARRLGIDVNVKHVRVIAHLLQPTTTTTTPTATTYTGEEEDWTKIAAGYVR